jgi:hypothetical protein
MRKSMAFLLLCGIELHWLPAFAEQVRSLEPMPIPNVKAPEGYRRPEVKQPDELKDPMKMLEDRLYANWEPSIGTPPNKSLSVRFVIEPDNSFSNVNLVHPTGIAQVDFAVIEAVAESSKFMKFPAGMQSPNSIQMNLKLSEKTKFPDCAAEYRRCHPSVSNDETIWHLVPPEALQCSKELPDAAVHSQHNLRVIKKALVNSRELESARSDWVEYFRNKQNPSAADISTQAKAIEKKYADLFEKKEPDNAGS